MSYKENSTIEQQACYYLTFNVVEWIDIFTRPVFKQIIVESSNYFIEKKGLIVHGWCLMTNHLHLIAQAKEGFSLPVLIDEFKKFTARIILADIDAEPEIRRIWIMKKFEEAGRSLRLTDKLQVWQTENHSVSIELENSDMINDQLHFIHGDPVRDRIVTSAEDYLYSSARDYTGIKGLVNVRISAERDESPFILRHITSYNRISKIQY